MHMFSAGVLALLAAAGADDLAVLQPEPGRLAPSSLVYSHLQQQAYAALDRRREAFEQLESSGELQQWQERRREFFVAMLGGFPEGTPLNAEIVGTLDGDGYRVEKVIFESRPRHHVTAALFLPEGEPPYPAVLVACGHTRSAKAAEYNQRMCILLARNGIAAFCYDPIGQGERSQFLTAEGEVEHSGTTTEHFLIGVGSILVGTNTAQFRVYDGMRAVDYLASRPDIDAERIGCTGCSGGGTESSYLMALDERIACAAPACYLTTFRKLIETIGPQDAEQNIFGQLAFGMDHPDYVIMRAPRPTLIVSTTGDYFDIGGAWDTFRQAKRFYGWMGFPERVDLSESPGGHGVREPGRVAMVRWMRRWLLGKDDAITDADARIFSEEELRCTPEGQVLLLPGERSVFDLNAERAAELATGREALWKKSRREEVRGRIRELAGIRPDDAIPALRARKAGSVERDGYRIDKLLLEREGEVPLPALRFVPKENRGEPCLYLHGEGKRVDAAAGGAIETLIREGHTVLAVDLTGIGETNSGGQRHPVGADWKTYYLAYLLGRSMAGIRAEDVLASARLLSEEQNGAKVRLIAVGEAGVPALHAAALAPERFAAVELRRVLHSWEDVVRNPDASDQLINTVHGALAVYDLPDLRRLAGRVTVIEPVDAAGNPVPGEASERR